MVAGVSGSGGALGASGDGGGDAVVVSPVTVAVCVFAGFFAVGVNSLLLFC